PATHQTGKDQSLTDRLRHDIVAGNLVPHQRLVEADVAEEHQASRGDARLALNELITEGLVERIPNRVHGFGESHFKRQLRSLRCAARWSRCVHARLPQKLPTLKPTSCAISART